MAHEEARAFAEANLGILCREVVAMQDDAARVGPYLVELQKLVPGSTNKLLTAYSYVSDAAIRFTVDNY